jgi:hypothetical protein
VLDLAQPVDPGDPVALGHNRVEGLAVERQRVAAGFNVIRRRRGRRARARDRALLWSEGTDSQT